MARQVFDQRAEEATLRNMIIEPDLAPLIANVLPEAECFVDRTSGAIYSAVLSLRNNRSAVDEITIAAELVRKGEAYDGKMAIERKVLQLCEQGPDIEGWEDHARIVREFWLLRLLINLTSTVQGSAGSPQGAVVNLLSELQKGTMELMSAADFKPPVSIGDAARQVLQSLMDRKEQDHQMSQDGLIGVPFPYKLLNDMTGGMVAGTVTLLGARPGNGKTTIMMNIAETIALYTMADGGGVYIQSLEQTHQQLGEKVLYTTAGVDSLQAAKGKTTDEEDGRIYQAATQLADMPIWIDDQKKLTWPQIRARCLMAKQRHNVSAIFIDYIQKIAKPKGRHLTQTDHMTEVAIALTELAADLNLPIIGLVQLNRGVEQRHGKKSRPKMSDIRDAGFLEQEAHNVMLLWPRASNDESGDTPTDLIVDKSRAGQVGDVPLLFLKSQGKFIERPDPEPEGYVDEKEFKSYYDKDTDDQENSGDDSPATGGN